MATPEHSADHARLWLGGQHRRILAALEDTVFHAGGLLVLTGDPGVGKTTLAKALISRLADRALAVRLPRPAPSVPAMIEALGNGFGVDVADRAPATFLRGLRDFLDNAVGQDQRVLIVVDEAHDLLPDVLAALENLLSADGLALKRRLSLLLVGQEELSVLLDQPPSHLRRLVTLSEHVPTLGAAEVESFVRHRLAISGVDPALFSDDAIRAVQVMSVGIPRLVIRLCDVALIGRAPNKPINARVIRERAERFGVVPSGMPVSVAYARSLDVAAASGVARIRAGFVLRNLARPGLAALGVAVAIVGLYTVASRGIIKAAAPVLTQEPVVSGPIPTPAAESRPRPAPRVDPSSRSRSPEPPAPPITGNAQPATTPDPIAVAPRMVEPDAVAKSTDTPRTTASPPRVMARPESIGSLSAAEAPPRLQAPQASAQASAPKTHPHGTDPERPPARLLGPAAPRVVPSRPAGAAARPLQRDVVPAPPATPASSASAREVQPPNATRPPPPSRGSADSADAPDPGAIIDWLFRQPPATP